MWYQLTSFCNFVIKSTNQHGVHSPFVFDLVTKCFYDNSVFPEYKTLENCRESLLKNDKIISVTDFGAGSRIFRSNQRKISDIAENAGISKKRAKLLFRIVRYLKSEYILEIGTSLGLATSALALGNAPAKVISLEGCANTAAEAKNQLEKSGIGNVEIKVGEFNSFLDTTEIRNSKFDLIYFDGNHQKEATLAYFEKLLTTKTNDSVWIFDDIHWSEEMTEAWEIIKKHPEVTVTIDTFQWGFVFFRKEQEREDFTIRT